MSAAHERLSIGLVLADVEFDRERNPQHIRQVVRAQSVIRRCALIENLIASAKSKLSARASGRSFVTQCMQALLLGIADNISSL